MDEREFVKWIKRRTQSPHGMWTESFGRTGGKVALRVLDPEGATKDELVLESVPQSAEALCCVVPDKSAFRVSLGHLLVASGCVSLAEAVRTWPAEALFDPGTLDVGPFAVGFGELGSLLDDKSCRLLTCRMAGAFPLDGGQGRENALKALRVLRGCVRGMDDGMPGLHLVSESALNHLENRPDVLEAAFAAAYGSSPDVVHPRFRGKGYAPPEHVQEMHEIDLFWLPFSWCADYRQHLDGTGRFHSFVPPGGASWNDAFSRRDAAFLDRLAEREERYPLLAGGLLRELHGVLCSYSDFFSFILAGSGLPASPEALFGARRAARGMRPTAAGTEQGFFL